MNEKRMHDEIEIDLGKLLRALLSKAWLIALTAVVGEVITFFATFLFVTPQYQSTAMFYVNNNSLSVGDASFSISSGDLVTSRNLVDSYIVILNTRETLDEVIAHTGGTYSYREVKNMISASAVNETEIFKVTVTNPDPQEAQKIANAIAQVLPGRIGTIIKGTTAEVVDSATVPTQPSSPSYTKNIVLGFMLGFLLTVGVIAVREIFDTAIRSDEDIMDVCQHPVLATVPDLTAASKTGYEYRYERESSKSKKNPSKRTAFFGKNISFTAAEAYKLLRTKLQFSFSDERNCRVIGISSSLSGEGKSLTSINLAYTLAQLGKKVVLIDCDMRRPTLAEKIKLAKHPGLSNYLTGQAKLEEIIQKSNFLKDDTTFDAVTAGQNPPNPVELLSSARMESLLNTLKGNYDYIIMDLPPVGEVSDAVAAAKNTDGILLVVRQNTCDRNALIDTVKQFEFIDAKILGIVYNCVEESGGKGYYKKYYRGKYRVHCHQFAVVWSLENLYNTTKSPDFQQEKVGGFFASFHGTQKEYFPQLGHVSVKISFWKGSHIKGDTKNRRNG